MIKRGFRKRAAAVWLTVAAVALLGFATSPAASAALRGSTPAAAPAAVPAGHGAASAPMPADTRQVCAAPAKPGVARCLSLIRTDVRARARATAAAAPNGYGPSSLQSAYKLPSATAGGGRTVAVVDAYDDPNAAADLAAYRSQYGLSACTAASGCFTKVNESGQASPLPAASGSTGWATEESLDIDMVSAVCPNCRILLVEANSPTYTDLGTAVNSAVSLGARYVSNSYGGAEFPAETSADSAYYNHPGVAVTASAGDGGYGVEFPAASPHVVAVGGTTLTPASNSRGWAETVWYDPKSGSGTGSGCSAYEPKPSWQTDTGCADRTDNDVSAVADPNTGVAMYDSYDQGGWVEMGGTSAASPIIAATYALGGYPAAGSYPASSTYAFAHSSALFDVTSGSDGSCSPAYLCTAGPGYDGPTGLGTPDGVSAFTGGGGGPGYVAAFQANTGALWFAGQGIGSVDTGLGMAAGTSPSVAALPTGGYVAAFQANTGILWFAGQGIGSVDTGLRMAAGTSPSITTLPGGAYVAAFQANTGALEFTGPTIGTINTGLGMAAGTSPSIGALPSINGGYAAAFQANTGALWFAGQGIGSLDTGQGMAAGTSPSFSALPSINGGYAAAFQANTGALEFGGIGIGTINTGLGMAAGTSPGFTALS
jgi:hypothetical protein